MYTVGTRWEDNINGSCGVNLRRWKADGTRSQLCAKAGFGVAFLNIFHQ
jgi:hypothetical protein